MALLLPDHGSALPRAPRLFSFCNLYELLQSSYSNSTSLFLCVRTSPLCPTLAGIHFDSTSSIDLLDEANEVSTPSKKVLLFVSVNLVFKGDKSNSFS